MKVWLDDIRKPPKGYIWCKNYNEIIFILMNKKVSIVDFDHDLGEEKSGYDVAKFIVENNIEIDSFKVHSQNPVGRDNIIHLLTHYGYTLDI